jgi:hypothetical protein
VVQAEIESVDGPGLYRSIKRADIAMAMTFARSSPLVPDSRCGRASDVTATGLLPNFPRL